MQVPKITKVVLNMGIGEGVADRKKVDNAAADLTLIAGQKAVITKSRKSIATYKLRDGQAIGAKVTLRKASHVRLHRPAGEHRAAARARLPRPQPEELRRPRQLLRSASRNTSFSRRSTSTRRSMSGAWISPFARTRATTKKRARC